MSKFIYTPTNEGGYICENDGTPNGSGLLYPSESLEHLSEAAKNRLAEIHNQNPDYDYEAAETILIDECLFAPERIHCPDCGASIINDGAMCFYCETMPDHLKQGQPSAQQAVRADLLPPR